MKYLLLISALMIVSCAQLMNGQQQPVIQKSVKEKIFFTTCSGAVEDWSSCNRKARSTCTNGYSEIKRFESAVGGRRELTFQCN
jgi:hypothetical protein